MPQKPDVIDPENAATIAGLFRERVRRTPHQSAYLRYSAEKQGFEAISWHEMSCSRAIAWRSC
jgi:long-chain acyl-CoA synthetase